MSLAYDDVIAELIGVCERDPAFGQVVSALIVRTLNGQVRLILDAPDDALPSRLEAALHAKVGRWFQGPVLAVSDKRKGYSQLARHLLEQARARVAKLGWTDCWPQGWPTGSTLPGVPRRAPDERWLALQAAVGKEPWLAPDQTEPATPPWPMLAKTPKITAFYGFKGGVGRTTAVATLAWHLARAGKSVVCVDLDLEAPGLGRLLSPTDLPTANGWVIDDILSHSATGQGLDALPIFPVDVHGARLHVAPAGVLGPTYIEKLARLDTLHRHPGQSPVHAALVALLQRIRASHKPDHILLDCRSGLHDLAGLALHDLAHVDVLVGRGDRQELDGLSVLLPALQRRRQPADWRVLVLRTFMELPVDAELLDGYRSDLYDLFAEALYGRDANGGIPAFTARGIAHDPCPIGDFPGMRRADWLGDVDRSFLDHGTYRDAVTRLEALWEPES